MLEQYTWPGNVRELRNVIERATILAEGEFIEPKHLPPLVVDAAPAAPRGVVADAGHDGRRGGAAPDPDDARAHARQQDARRRDPRHQPEDAAQQAEQAEDSRRQGTRLCATCASASRASRSRRHGDRRPGGRRSERACIWPRWRGSACEESHARGELLANAIFHRAREVVGERRDPYAALRSDGGLRSILESSIYSKNVTDAAIVDASGIVVATAIRAARDSPLPRAAI